MNMNFSPDTPHGWLILSLQTRLERARQSPQRGASAIELVIISAALIGIAIGLVALIRSYVNDKSGPLQ